MAATIDIEPLLSRLYEAALDPALWPSAWAEATAAAGGIAPSLIIVADGCGTTLRGAPGWSGHAVRPISVDPGSVVPTDDTAASEPRAYAERRAGPPPSETEQARTAELTQHLRRAVRMRTRLELAATVQAANAAALAATNTGVVVVTAGTRLVYADLAGRQLAESVGLELNSRRGGLQTPDPYTTHTLHGLIHDAVAGGVGGDMLMRGADGLAVALGVSCLPSDPSEDGNLDTGGTALLLLRRVAEAVPSARRIAALFGLTRSETDVAVALVAGKDVAAIAAGRGVSPHTVQAQVRSALGKAKVTGVQELGMLFARLG